MKRSLRRGWHLTGAIGLGLLARHPAAVFGQTVVRPEARLETTPVPHREDAADDPAIWIHPRDPALSLVLGTDKEGGLHAYNMDGSERQVVAAGARPNNVDVVYGFNLDGHAVDLAVAGVQARKQSKKRREERDARGLKVWAIDAGTRQLTDVTSGGSIPILGGAAPFGACGYRSRRSGRIYVFVTDEKGHVEQYELTAAGDGRVGATKARSLAMRSLVEGCVADDELGFLYAAEETVGIWKFGAEPDAGATGKLVARVGEHGLTADVEGLTMYYGAGGHGYLIASSQGDNTFKVYERAGENRYVLTIDPKGGRIDDVSDTDGIAVTSCPTSPQFPHGLFIVHDGANAGGNQNFKLYAWEDIAGTSLLIDRTCPRRAAAG